VSPASSSGALWVEIPCNELRGQARVAGTPPSGLGAVLIAHDRKRGVGTRLQAGCASESVGSRLRTRRGGGSLVAERVRLPNAWIDRCSDFQGFWFTLRGNPDPDGMRSVALAIPTRLDVVRSERTNHCQRSKVGGCVKQHNLSRYAYDAPAPSKAGRRSASPQPARSGRPRPWPHSASPNRHPVKTRIR